MSGEKLSNLERGVVQVEGIRRDKNSSLVDLFCYVLIIMGSQEEKLI